MAFEKANWIWLSKSDHEVNEYADFSAVFTAEKSLVPVLRICSKTEYAVHVNGRFVGFQQFGDFPGRKVYDEYDLSAFVNDGENVLSITALSKNYSTSSHIKNGKGVIFEIADNNGLLLVSDCETLSRLSRGYRSGPQSTITSQLGMSFFYDFNAEEDWVAKKQAEGENGFGKSIVSDEKTTFVKRPIARLSLLEKLPFKDIGNGLYDAGKECVGQLYFDIESDCEKDFDIYYGEHIVDGVVRKEIGGRSFILHFRLKKGRNVFTGWFLRLGLRYLEVSDKSVKVHEMGIIPAVYPVQRKEYTGTRVSKEIYDTAVYTLECCMHDHYEDCPWREQAQYTMDSRTQILCGYYAFGETAMPSAALRTMAYDLTDHNTFRMTMPSNKQLSIPIFSLVYPLMLVEYYEYTKDATLLADVYENTRRMLENYLSERNNGLLYMMKDWNFFEWADGLHNEWEIMEQKGNREDFPFGNNAYMIIALENFAKVCEVLGKDGARYRQIADEIRTKTHDTFYCEEKGLFYSHYNNGVGSGFTEYDQVFALYANIAKPSEEQALIDVLTTENDLVPLTLSNYIYKYEVLLKKGGYDEFVCREIEKLWGYMLQQGATTFWETIKGDQDFNKAGSLCHGWSSAPIYVAHQLNKKTI